MEILPIKTRTCVPPQDDLFRLLDETDFYFREKDILVVTSKVVSIHEGRTVLNDGSVLKEELVKQEADRWLPKRKVPGGTVFLTIKESTLVSAAGVDESNASGYFVLWPGDANGLAKEIHAYLQKRFKVTQCGVIITDSHSTPLRHGSVGIAIAFYGIAPFRDYRGKKDLFGRDFKVAHANVVDGIAAGAVVAMGEGSESTPLAVVREVHDIDFVNKDFYDEWVVSEEDDVYWPLLEVFRKRKE